MARQNHPTYQRKAQECPDCANKCMSLPKLCQHYAREPLGDGTPRSTMCLCGLNGWNVWRCLLRHAEKAGSLQAYWLACKLGV